MRRNTLYGDAYAMYDNARGGDDTLIGGDRSGSFNNHLYRRRLRHVSTTPAAATTR